jgi:choline dehydrogenase-like flavoprotein
MADAIGPGPSVPAARAEGVDVVVLGAGSAGCVVAARLADAGA